MLQICYAILTQERNMTEDMALVFWIALSNFKQLAKLLPSGITAEFVLVVHLLSDMLLKCQICQMDFVGVDQDVGELMCRSKLFLAVFLD